MTNPTINDHERHDSTTFSDLDGSTDRASRIIRFHSVSVPISFTLHFFNPPTQTRPASTSPHKLQNKKRWLFSSVCLTVCLTTATTTPTCRKELLFCSAVCNFDPRLRSSADSPGHERAGYRQGHLPSARTRSFGEQ